MSKTTFTINAKTLFPIDKLKDCLKEAFAVSETIGPAIITKGNRPAYAIIRIRDNDPDSDPAAISRALAEQIDFARTSSKGHITTEPYRWKK